MTTTEETRPFRNTPDGQEGTLRTAEDLDEGSLKRRFLEMTESDKYFFNHIMDLP